MRDWALFLGSDWIGTIWNELPTSIRTGGSGTEAAFGVEYFDLMQQRPETGELFDAAMAAASRFTAPFVCAGYDFAAFTRVCDVGGGTGTLLGAILTANPGLHGVVFDLPDVVAGAPRSSRRAASPTVARSSAVTSSQSVPTGCDLYVLQSIVHDWDDESAVRILARVREAMTPGSRVLVLEGIVPTSGVAHPSKYADLLMLVLTGKGRERTEPEYAALAARAGLRLERVVNLLARDGIELSPSREPAHRARGRGSSRPRRGSRPGGRPRRTESAARVDQLAVVGRLRIVLEPDPQVPAAFEREAGDRRLERVAADDCDRPRDRRARRASPGTGRAPRGSGARPRAHDPA